MRVLNKELLMDAVGMLDDELITNHLRMRERLKKRKAVAWKRGSLVAACLAVVMLIGYGASYIPKEYNFEGSEENSHLLGVAVKKDYWIYQIANSCRQGDSVPTSWASVGSTGLEYYGIL